MEIVYYDREEFEKEFSSFEDTLLKHGGIPGVIRKGTTIGDANIAIPHTSYYIKRGIAKLSLINEEGAEHILFFFGKGGIYPVTRLEETLTMEIYLHLVAVTDLEVITFPSSRIIEMNGQDNALFAAALDHYVRYANTLLYKLLMNTYNDSAKCVSSFLYLYAHHSFLPSGGTIDLTQEQVGQIIGLSRAQVTRILNTLRGEGIIQTSHSKIKVLDMERLRDFCPEIVDDDRFIDN